MLEALCRRKTQCQASKTELHVLHFEPFKRAVVSFVLELGGCLEICCWQMETRFSLFFFLFFLEKEEKITWDKFFLYFSFKICLRRVW